MAFTVTTARAVRLRVEVYDLTGKSLLTAYDGALVSGIHRIPFNGARLRARIRFYPVTGNDGDSGAPSTFEGKCIVVR
jgi:hypothetical protein